MRGDMDFQKYQELAHKTSRFDPDASPAERERNQMMALFGLAGETGETLDLLKKVFFHDHPLDRDKLSKELGDILWYVAELCTAFGLEMNVVAAENIEKLRQRYPEGFSSEKSINRKP